MHRALVRAVLTLIALALLTACDGTPKIAAPDESNVQVDTPAYRTLKSDAGIQDCPAPATSKGGLPAVSLPCLGGGTRVDLSTLKGPLIVNFWGSDCAPCRKEMPALQQFHEKYGDQVPILGIDIEDTYPGVALKQAVRRGVTYPLVADPGGKTQETALRIVGKPSFFFLSADGTLSKPVAGGLDSVDEVVAMVDQQLGMHL